MNNAEAMTILVSKRAAVNAAINGLNEYADQMAKGHLTNSTVKKNIRDSVIANALIAGADISDWDGTVAPDPDPE
jgi:hypothetical protein|tara:strand:- start:50 stop:274 length:225 start_codon:yes stop_codon:yes gene_type:complete